MRKLVFMVLMCVASISSNAQLNLGKIVNAVTNNSNVGNAITNIADNLLGTANVSETSLVGTWEYASPCLAMESENVLANMGGAAVAAPMEKKLGALLEKVGMKPGQVKLVFNADSTMTAQVGNSTPVQLKWSVEGNTLTVSKGTLRPITAKCNIKLTTSGMQLAIESKKLMSLLNTICSTAANYSSTIGTVSSLLGNYQGVQIGLKFNKQ